MLKNYLKSTLRFLSRNKLFTGINILSLTIALSSCLVIGLYLHFELSYDKMHSKYGQIYRYYTHSEASDVSRDIAFAPLAMAPALQQEFPEVLDYVRLWKYRRAMPVSLLEEDKTFYEENFGWADPSFFEVFDFEVIKGNPKKLLQNPGDLVLTESAAKRYFGDENPMGKNLHFRAETDITLTVTGVMQDFPINSHFKFDMIASIITADKYFWAGGTSPNLLQSWENLFVGGYLLLQPGADVAQLKQYADSQIAEKLPVPGRTLSIEFQPLQDIHLHSHLEVGEWEVNSDIDNIYLFAIIGIIILFLGTFNFINILTAYAGQRAREIGIRKTFGSRRIQIIMQSYTEIGLLVFISLVLSFGMVGFLQNHIPFVAHQFMAIWQEPQVWFIATGVILALLLLAGVFPLFFLSRYQPANIIRGQFWRNSQGAGIRKSLVFTQFVIAAALIIASIVIYRQVSFLNQKELGYNASQVIVVPIHNDGAIIPSISTLKEEYKQLAGVKNVSASSHVFMSDFTYWNSYRLPGAEQEHRWQRYTVDHEFPATYELELVAGRYFDENIASDSSAFILNESAVKEFGLTPEEAVGQPMVNVTQAYEGRIVGVVKDFHFKSLYTKMEPFVMMVDPQSVDYISVHLSSENFAGTIVQLREIWQKVIPDAVFHYDLFDAYSAGVYQKAEYLQTLFFAFSAIAIFIACLGLFGLAAFTLHLRLKEIGIRKVLGASLKNIWGLLVKDFLILIVVANLVIWPVIYYLMQKWLDNFAYQVGFEWYYFAIAISFSLLIAGLTITYHTWRAARVNPVDILKNE